MNRRPGRALRTGAVLLLLSWILGWVPAARAASYEAKMFAITQCGGRDEETLRSGQISEDTYAPGLLVGVVPAAPADPDEFQAAGEELWVPLLGNAALE